MCLLIFLSIYRVFSHGLYGSVHRLHGKLGDLQLAPRIHGELRPVRALTLRRNSALPLGTRHYSVHPIVIETGEHHPTGLFHRGLPPVGAALLGVYHVTLLIQQRVIRIPIRRFNGEHRLVLVLRVIGDLVIPLHHRGQNLRRISVGAPHLRCLHAGGCVAASFRLIHQIPGSRATLVKDGSSGDASVLHVQNGSVQICDEIPVAGLRVKGGDPALSVLIQAPCGVHIPCIGSEYQGIRVELKGIGGSVSQAVIVLYLTGSVIPAPYQVVYFRLIVWQQEIAPFAVIVGVDGDRMGNRVPCTVVSQRPVVSGCQLHIHPLVRILLKGCGEGGGPGKGLILRDQCFIPVHLFVSVSINKPACKAVIFALCVAGIQADQRNQPLTLDGGPGVPVALVVRLQNLGQVAAVVIFDHIRRNLLVRIVRRRFVVVGQRAIEPAIIMDGRPLIRIPTILIGHRQVICRHERRILVRSVKLPDAG